MAEVLELQPRLRKKRVKSHHHALQVIIDVDIEHIPKSCDEVNLGIRMSKAWVWYKVLTLPKTRKWLDHLEDIQEFAGQHTVFNIPTVLFFADGKELFRLVRAFGLNELEEKIEKIYKFY